MQLATTETLQGKAGTNSAITYTVMGDAKSTTDSYQKLAQGQLSTSAATPLYTVPASTQALISTIQLANTTASPVTGVIFYVNGSASGNQINGGFTVPANGSATYSKGQWQVYDSSGALITTVTVTLTGDVTGSGTSSVATTIAANAVTDAKFRQGAARTVVGVTGNATANVADIQGGTDQVLRVNGAGTALGFGAVDISKAAAATGVLQSTSMPALTGDVTNSAGSLSTTIANDVVSNAKLVNMAAHTYKGNNTGATVDPIDVTSTQLTADLDVATTSLKGLQSSADKLKEDNMWYDIVADGGADRTGSVDATAIIQAAINAVATAGGGVVYIPRGTFKVSSAITITGNYVTIRGASRVASKLVPTHATGNVFTASGIFCRFEYIRIEPTSNILRTASYAIEFTSTASNGGCQWVDILFMWSAIRATGQLCRLEDMNIRECGYGAINGCLILIDSFTDQYLSKIVSDNGTVAPNAPMAGFSGIRVTNLSSLLMSDCQIIHCGTGMDVVPTGTNGIPSIYCMNTFFDQGTYGARFTPGSGSIVRCRFIGVWFSGNSVAGVQLNGASIDGLDFIGCEFYGAPSQPFGIDAVNATEWSVRASRFAGNGTNAIRTTAAAAHSFSITDCTIGAVSGVTANAQGINIQAGTYKRYQILDNRGLESNTTPGVIDLGVVAAADQKNVSNNMGAVVGGLQQPLSSAGAAAIAGRGAVTSGTTETFLMTYRIPANAVAVGQTFEWVGWLQSSSTGTLIVRGKSGAAGTIAGDTEVFLSQTTSAGAINSYSLVTVLFQVIALGPTATVVASGQVQNSAVAAPNTLYGKTLAAEVTANTPTTAAFFFTISATASAGTYTVKGCSMRAI